MSGKSPRTPASQPREKAAALPLKLADFGRFCRKLTLDNGKPFKLEDFERRILADLFRGSTETVVILPKKNGKSTLLAALALHHLTVTPGAMVPILAASRDQAMWIFEQARGFVDRSPDLQRMFRVLRGYREIRIGDDSGAPSPKVIHGLIKVLAADEDNFDGIIPTLGLVDELHRHKKTGGYETIRDGLVGEARMITISTAGSNLDSPLGDIRTKAHQLESFTREGKYNYALSPDGAFAFHEWCLDAEDDVDHMPTVKEANPASWQTPERLERRHNSPTMTPWQWLRFACGIWTEGEEPWIEPRDWDVLAEPGLEFTEGEEVWLGVDIGVRGDSTAVAVAARREGHLAVTAYILKPPVGLEVVEQQIRELCRTYRVQVIAYDPWGFRRSAEILEAEGLPIGDDETLGKFPQSPERMSQASANLFRLIETQELRHNGDPLLRAHVLAGVTKETERGWRLQKDPRSRRPIDALIALCMACYAATMGPAASEPGYVSMDDVG